MKNISNVLMWLCLTAFISGCSSTAKAPPPIINTVLEPSDIPASVLLMPARPVAPMKPKPPASIEQLNQFRKELELYVGQLYLHLCEVHHRVIEITWFASNAESEYIIPGECL